MSNDNNSIKIGVGLMPIVQSVKTASVGQVVYLQLISGLKTDEIVWRCEGKNDVPTLIDSTVIFDEPGLYIPVVRGYLQHVSYGISVVIQAPYMTDI